jgi:GMP synthase (glutamine-hydrolysing)
MTLPVLILQHVPWERPALLGGALTSAGVPWTLDTIVNTGDPGALPRLTDVSGIAILGGPMDALDVDRYPGLALEANLALRAIDAGVPLLGICLGHQIIATALGAALHKGVASEFGIADVTIAADDPIYGVAGSTRPALHWHGDVVDLPSGGTLLASTPQTPNQSFRVGDAVLAMQFHAEVDRPMLDSWLSVSAMADDLPTNVRATIETDFDAAAESMGALARTAFSGFAAQALAR